MHTCQLREVRKTDSMGRWLIRGGVYVDRIWAGAVRRPPAGKRGAAFHAALVELRGCRIRRVGGCGAQEMRFWRFLRNSAVTSKEMVCHAVTGTAARVAGHDIVVLPDTSELALGGGRRWSEGLGPVRH